MVVVPRLARVVTLAVLLISAPTVKVDSASADEPWDCPGVCSNDRLEYLIDKVSECNSRYSRGRLQRMQQLLQRARRLADQIDELADRMTGCPATPSAAICGRLARRTARLNASLARLNVRLETFAFEYAQNCAASMRLEFPWVCETGSETAGYCPLSPPLNPGPLPPDFNIIWPSQPTDPRERLDNLIDRLVSSAIHAYGQRCNALRTERRNYRRECAPTPTPIPTETPVVDRCPPLLAAIGSGPRYAALCPVNPTPLPGATATPTPTTAATPDPTPTTGPVLTPPVILTSVATFDAV